MRITNPGLWPAGRTELEQFRDRSSMHAHAAAVIKLATDLASLAPGPEPASAGAGAGREEVGEEPEQHAAVGLRLVD